MPSGLETTDGKGSGNLRTYAFWPREAFNGDFDAHSSRIGETADGDDCYCYMDSELIISAVMNWCGLFGFFFLV